MSTLSVMALKTKTQTITSATRVEISPATGFGEEAKLMISAVAGTVRLYADGTTSDYVTFSDSNALPGALELEPGDEVWVAADTTDVVLQTITTGASA